MTNKKGIISINEFMFAYKLYIPKILKDRHYLVYFTLRTHPNLQLYENYLVHEFSRTNQVLKSMTWDEPYSDSRKWRCNILVTCLYFLFIHVKVPYVKKEVHPGLTSNSTWKKLSKRFLDFSWRLKAIIWENWLITLNFIVRLGYPSEDFHEIF